MTEKPPKNPLQLIGDPGSTGPKPPRELGKAGSDLWYRIQRDYDIRDAGGVEVLLQAAQTADRVDALAAQIAADGEVVRSRTGPPRAHPALREELHARASICRCLQRLGIVTPEVSKPVGRPPTGGLGIKVPPVGGGGSPW